MRKITVDQGALNHRARKPTSLGTNLALDHLQGKRDSRRLATPVKDLSGPELAAWAEGLKVEIVKALKTSNNKNFKMARLSAEEAWKLHLCNDHVPYRRLPGVCDGWRHWEAPRKGEKQVGVCPEHGFRVKGEDAYGKGYRFAMIFTCTFPRLEGVKEEVKIVEGEKDEDRP